MIARSFMLRRFPRSAVLASCLSVALGQLPEAHAADTSGRASYASSEFIPPSLRVGVEAASQNTSGAVPEPRSVDNCGDDGSPGTLRAEIDAAASGDTIDLSHLPCSMITLVPGSPIQILQNSLMLSGPGAGNLTISGGNHSLIFEHLGTGTLQISDLTIGNGYHFDKGGCIYSAANVVLTGSVVSNCMVASFASDAEGGGIYSAGDLTLISSTITSGHALALAGPGSIARGGGAWVRGHLQAKYSTISYNSAFDANSSGHGGGIVVPGAEIEGSTISGNTANYCAGIEVVDFPLNVTNSTISGNSATRGGGGICGSPATTLTSSTVVFNKCPVRASGVSIAFADLTLHSSIVADNIGSNDIAGSVGFKVLGSNNLVTSSDLQLPADTIQDCPKLDRLADNGGATRTHALRLGSPAIDHGNNDAGLMNDQRGSPRVAESFADIGAFERQAGAIDERIFFDGFEESLGSSCDQ